MRVFYSVFALFLFFVPNMQAQVCMGFDGMSGNYGATNPNQFGQVFYSQNGISLATTGFVDANGNVTNTASFFAGTFLYSGLFTAASGVFVKVNPKADMIIGLAPAASEVTFDFIDRNSMMNFSVNGQDITVIDNLSDLPTAIAPGVTMSVSTNTIGTSIIGTVTLTGYVTEVIVGGDDMGIDDICFMETAAVCTISNPTATPSVCNSTGQFSVDLNFDYNEVGANGFTVSGNGVTYGTYNYTDLPITLDNLEGDATTNYVFVIADVDDPDCADEVELGTINCPVCGISNIVATPTDCVSEEFYMVVVDFEYENTGSNGFDIFVDGQYQEYWTYAELPITMELPTTGANTLLLTFCDNNSTTCCSSVTIEPLDCGAFDCAISNPVATPSACDANGGFTVDLNFNYENAGSSFTVAGNGTTYGTFFYAELPVTLDGFIGDNSTIYEFVITDSDDTACTVVTTVGPVDCPLPCEVAVANANPLDCTSDSTLNVMLDLESANTGMSFSVYETGGAFVGNFNYADLPITIEVGVVPGQTTESLSICDIDNPNCCTSAFFDTPNCVPPSCDMGGLSVESTGCDGNGDFGVSIDFLYANTSTQFSMYVNGSPAGTFLYVDLPLTLPSYLTGDGTTSYTFMVQDFDDAGCNATFTMQPVSCMTNVCAISDIVVDPGQCTSDSTFSLFVDFEFVNNGSNGFQIFSGSSNIGVFDYTDLPLSLTDFPATGGGTQNIFICDIDNPDCCQEMTFTGLDCTPDPVCEMDGLDIIASSCDSAGLFTVQLDFTSANTSMLFTVAGNGTMYGTYNYADLPISLGPLAGDGTTPYEFVITDSESPNCTTFAELGVVNCVMSCELFTPVVDPIQCTSDSTFALYLDFDYANVSGSAFNVFASGTMVGTYDYTSLPLEIEDFPSMGTNVVTLMVCDTQDPNCCTTTTFESIDCSMNCNIFGVFAEALSCDQGTFLVELSLEYQNPGPLGFQVFGNGTNYGNFSYDELPITIGLFEGDGVTEYEFVAADLTNTDCSNFTILPAVNCVDQCMIDEVVATQLDCNDEGEFMVTLSFDANNIGSEGYNVIGNGTDYGVFSYDTNALIGPFPGDGETMYEFILSDMVNPNCVAGVEMEAQLCTTSSVLDAFDGAVAIRYNFVGEQLMVDLETPFAETSEILIYDALGNLRYTSSLAAGATSEMIDVANLGTGLYICQLRNSDGAMSQSFVRAK